MPSIFSKGNVMLVALIFLGIFTAVGTSLLSYTTAYSRATNVNAAATQALALAEAGMDKAVYELNTNPSYAGEADTALGSGTFSVTTSIIDTLTKQVTVVAYVPNRAHPTAMKTVTADIGIDSATISFRYGVQVGAGGVTLANNATINGNIYANGSINGNGSSSVITGDAVATSTIEDVKVLGNARAKTLQNCTVSGNAVYVTLASCAVTGTKTATTSAPAAADMPISDQQIYDWETAAAAGGVINGNYSVNGTQNLGPKEIIGNLTVSGTLVLTGPVWVRGDITVANNASITVSASLGASGTVLVADYPGNEANSGRVSLANNVTVSGNGAGGSAPLILSTNSGTNAITMANNASGIILYASRGRVTVSNNASVNQITAYQLVLSNNVTVNYQSGLASQEFSNGPGGSWVFIPGTYTVK